MPTFTLNYQFNKPNVNSPDDEDLWGGQLNDNWDNVDGLIKANTDAIASVSSVPIGVPLPYFGNAAPADHYLCYGQSIGNVGSGANVESADNEALFNVVKQCAPNLGTEVFANGDIVNIPDLRGRTIAGKDNMGGTSADRLSLSRPEGVDGTVLGAVGGEEDHTQTVAELVEHDHIEHDATTGGGTGGYGGYGTRRSLDTSSTGGGEAMNNVQPTLVLNQIVRYK